MSIVLYVLKGCPYCNNALMLLKENNIKHKAILVEDKDKEKYKKLNKMNTLINDVIIQAETEKHTLEIECIIKITVR